MKRIEFNQLNNYEQKLIRAAISSREKAYAPISNFRVGASILTEDNEIICGVNVEVSSFSPTICAERNAIFSYITSGKRNFTKIAIYGSMKDTFPCGVCRQVIYEFSPECEVFIVNSMEDISMYKISELLPNGFRLEEK